MEIAHQNQDHETLLREALELATKTIRMYGGSPACADALKKCEQALAAVPPLAPIKNASPIERRIIWRLVTDILARGYSISVWDGGALVLVEDTDPETIFKALASTDRDELFVHALNGQQHWILLIWGNDVDIISDYSVALEPVVKGANELADSLE